MTEKQYLTLTGSADLPLHDENDHRCRDLDQTVGPEYDGVYEATEIDVAQIYLRDPTLKFRGGIRFFYDSGLRSVNAYFWKRR